MFYAESSFVANSKSTLSVAEFGFLKTTRQHLTLKSSRRQIKWNFDIYHIADAGSDERHFEQLPHIIFHDFISCQTALREEEFFLTSG